MKDLRTAWLQLSANQRRRRIMLAISILPIGMGLGALRYVYVDEDVPVEQRVTATVTFIQPPDVQGQATIDRVMKVQLNGEEVMTTPYSWRMPAEDADKLKEGDLIELDIAHGKYTGRLLIKQSRLKR